MNPLDELTIDDLDEEQRELADCIGFEAYKQLIATYAGNTINVRMPDRLMIGQRNRKICAEYNGYNLSALARRYGLTERHIRNIIAGTIQEVRQAPIDGDGQISFFKDKDDNNV